MSPGRCVLFFVFPAVALFNFSCADNVLSNDNFRLKEKIQLLTEEEEEKKKNIFT